MPPAPKKCILLIGVSEADRASFQGALEDFNLHFASSTEKAINERDAESTDLIFIDRPGDLLPLESMRRLKEADMNVPMILILREGDEKTAVAAVAEGISDYLAHGELVPAIIRMTVTRAIERRKWEILYREAGTLRDMVTGLYNRAYFETRLAEERKRSERYAFPLSMIFFSIEQFSLIGDKYGKEARQALLKEFSSLLSKNLRSSDLLASVGENRFGLLLPHTSVNQALAAWDRLLGIVAENPFSLKEDNFYISLKGVLAPLNREVEAIDNWLNRLEERMKKEAETSGEESLILYIEP